MRHSVLLVFAILGVVCMVIGALVLIFAFSGHDEVSLTTVSDPVERSCIR